MHSSGESEFQTDCLKYLNTLGIYRINVHGSAWCGKGSPDVIACICGRFVAFELKVGENEMQPDQRIRRKEIIRSGGVHYCPRTIEEFQQIVNDCIRRWKDDS
jgi:hypothetical protein